MQNRRDFIKVLALGATHGIASAGADRWAEYRQLAKGMNPDRTYVFLDVGAFEERFGKGDDFNRAAREELVRQLRDQGIEPSAQLLNSYVFAANYMAGGGFDGDAKIFNQDGREVSMVYWSVNRSNKEQLVRACGGGIKGPVSGEFLSSISIENLVDEVIRHEIGHATSRERNAQNTRVRYETGPDGLYRNHRSELRAEIVGAMTKMRRDKSPVTAQAFNDLRAVGFMELVGKEVKDEARVTPYMEYFVFVQTQKVIDEARKTGRYDFTDQEIIQTADRIMWEEDKRLQATRRNGDGGELEKEGRRLAHISRQAEGDLQTALQMGLFDPEKDRELVGVLSRAYTHVTGRSVSNGVRPPSRSEPPRNGRPPATSNVPPGCEGVSDESLEIARRIGGVVQRPDGGVCDPDKFIRKGPGRSFP